MADEVSADVRQAASVARRSLDPIATERAKRPLPTNLTDVAYEYRGEPHDRVLTMLEAIREVLLPAGR